MKRIATLILCALLLAAFTIPAHAGNAVVAAGAGYKKMVNALNTAYEKATGKQIERLYGNMGRVTTLAKESGNVDIVLGDQSFLERARLPMAVQQVLGQGRLVLAFAKGSPFNCVADLDNDKVGRIAMPDSSKAIYGKAARQFLTNTDRLPGIKPKLVEVSTVPQVFSYLATKEVDMGFLNLTHALNVKDKIGGYVIVDDGKYTKINILAALLSNSPNPDEAKAFLEFLKTPEAREIITRNGL
ncbi:molybdate ABC transporter substrate-binding protein [Pseudodesulfovibrio cashew]|uniref:Molybdate ABC transporter substrate-binding protein n=1 Tax=Pseudodesulfovibrio cashew TaxID=2678688 RepID=A0A6I6JJB2_9BACT|nr:molybdate ABC transporter substrate-binding protein [Pseudodesulfovibrio cashew]QGY40402.1 molybdate ABC transporter substrate-binding protein [Pseudodesulfovibrio cashew]